MNWIFQKQAPVHCGSTSTSEGREGGKKGGSEETLDPQLKAINEEVPLKVLCVGRERVSVDPARSVTTLSGQTALHDTVKMSQDVGRMKAAIMSLPPQR